MKETVKETTQQKPKRAKRIRKELAAEKAAAKPPVVEPDQVDEYDEAAVKAMVAKTPEVRFNHAQYFTDDEDRIIAAGINQRIQLYKIAASLRCSYPTLKKHIEKTPVLAEMVQQARERECGELREAVDDLVKMRHPQVVMWRAKQLMPNEYGDAVETEEDDTRIVIGAIPDELIAEADRAQALAAEKPPEVGLSAMMDSRVKGKDEAKDQKSDDQQRSNAPQVSLDAPVSPDSRVSPDSTDTQEDPPDEEAGVTDDEISDEDDDFSTGDGFDFGGGDDLGF